MSVLRRWLASRAGDPDWGERGQLGPSEALLITFIVGAFAAGLGGLIYYASSDSLPGPVPTLPPGARPLDTFPAPPDNDCATRVLALFKGDVTWSATEGWNMPDLPRPKVPYKATQEEIKEYNDKAIAWNAAMAIRVGSVQKEMKEQDCFKVQAPIAGPGTGTPESTPTLVNVSATYTLTYGSRQGTCHDQLKFPATLTVQHTPGDDTVTLRQDGGSASTTAALTSGPEPRISGPLPSGGFVSAQIRPAERLMEGDISLPVPPDVCSAPFTGRY